MAFTKREKEARERYKELLQAEGSSESRIKNYVGGVQGVLSDLAREAGILEEASLFLVDSKAEQERIRDWWVETGKNSSLSPSNKTQMETFISVFWRLPLERTRTRMPAQRLRAPTHGVRLRFLFQVMAENRERDNALLLYQTLFWVLRRDENSFYDTNALKEEESAFRALRRDILAGLQEPEEVGEELEEIFPDPHHRARMYRDVVYQCVSTYGGQILWDLRYRRLPFEKSILAPIAAICAHPTGDDTASMLELIRLVLEDSNAEGGREDPTAAPGAALTDSRLWESGVLDPWLKEKGGAADRFAALVLHAQSLTGQTKTLARAEELYSEAISLAEKNWESMKKALPEESWWPVVPAEQVEQSFDRTVLSARLGIRRAEVLTAMAGEVDAKEDTRHYWLMKAREDLRRARVTLRRCLTERQTFLEAESGHPATYVLFVRKNLCEARTHLLLSRQEKEENCLADAVQLYFRPAREDLAAAEQYLEAMADSFDDYCEETARRMREEHGELSRQRKELTAACAGEYFAETSPVIRRMALRSPADTAAYHAEHDAWERELGVKLPPLPEISRPLDPESLFDPMSFEAVYSGAMDSVTGKNVEQNKEPMELTVFQILGSSKTALLQFNQIVDNRSMLSMLFTPGFRQACRKGIVALSCYGNLNSPMAYLKQALEKPKFKFSSTTLYDLPENADEAAVKNSLRQLMLNHLKGENGAALSSFPAETREEVEFLTECYYRMEECFQPADLLRYHQKNLQNQPHRELVNVPLDQVIRGRLEAMERAGKDPALMETLWALAQVCQGDTDRSVYDEKIKALGEQGKYPAAYLEKFRKLVYQCYFFSNGRRSCKTILHTETDQDLILPGDVLRVGDYQLDDLYYQRRLPGKNSKIDWSDISHVAMIVRAIDARDKRLSAQARARIKERETGCGYTATEKDAYLTDVTAKTANGNVTHIAPSSQEEGEGLGFHREKN